MPRSRTGGCTVRREMNPHCGPQRETPGPRFGPNDKNGPKRETKRSTSWLWASDPTNETEKAKCAKQTAAGTSPRSCRRYTINQRLVRAQHSKRPGQVRQPTEVKAVNLLTRCMVRSVQKPSVSLACGLNWTQPWVSYFLACGKGDGRAQHWAKQDDG